MIFNNRNKADQVTAVVTGAYGGIGRALCYVLATKGANLYLVGRNEERLEQLHVELQPVISSKQIIRTFSADFSSWSQLEDLGGRLVQETPAINVLINNAGINYFGLFENTADDEFIKLLNINVMAQIRLSKALLPALKKQSWARIVNVGSVFGTLGFPGFSGYCTSKFALRGFSEALSRELADTTVSVGHFMARATNTPLNNEAVMQMNKELKTKVDSPMAVAQKLASFIHSNKLTSCIGWPEKLFIRINALAPMLVSQSISKQLPIIKRFAKA